MPSKPRRPGDVSTSPVNPVTLAVGFIIAIGVLVSFPVLIDWLPRRLADLGGLDAKGRSTELSRIRTAELALLAGMIAVFGAYYTHRTFRLNHQGQITERFTRAVDQLGSEKTEIRVGGIYALQRIARESSVDHEPTMEILTGFLREQSRWSPAKSAGSGSRNGRKRATPVAPRTDIQAALTVLAHRTEAYDTRTFNLTSTDLRGADFHGASLVGVDLSSSNLSGADLSGADLTNAKLARVRLVGARLANTNLSAADLREADLSYCDLTATGLFGLATSSIAVPDASYHSAGVSGAMLRSAYQAEVTRSHNERLVLQGVALVGADLTGLDLTGADFTGADLRNAHLNHAILRDVTLVRANSREPISRERTSRVRISQVWTTRKPDRASCSCGAHSHSIVPGGLLVMSSTTRLTSRISLIMREAICSSRS